MDWQKTVSNYFDNQNNRLQSLLNNTCWFRPLNVRICCFSVTFMTEKWRVWGVLDSLLDRRSNLRTLRSIFPKCICQELSGDWSEKRTCRFDSETLARLWRKLVEIIPQSSLRAATEVIFVTKHWHIGAVWLTTQLLWTLRVCTFHRYETSSCCVSIKTAADFELVASQSALLTQSFLNPLHLHCTERWLQVFNFKLRLRFCVLGLFGLDYRHYNNQPHVRHTQTSGTRNHPELINVNPPKYVWSLRLLRGHV